MTQRQSMDHPRFKHQGMKVYVRMFRSQVETSASTTMHP